MQKHTTRLILVSIVFVMLSGTASADKQLVSAKLRLHQGPVVIAVCQKDGNALVLWVQHDPKNNSNGKVYAAELIRQADGSYKVGEPFLVSLASGSNQRPWAIYLEAVGKYLIAWDTSLFDIQGILTLPEPYPSAEVYARTYTPSGAAAPAKAEGGLGDIVKVSEYDTGRSVMPYVLAMDSNGTSPSAGTEVVYIGYLASNDGGPTGKGIWEVGMWGSKWAVKGNAAGPASAADITKNESMKMTAWNMLGTPVSAFLAGDGFIYAVGARLIVNVDLSGDRGYFKIDPNNYNVTYRKTADLDPVNNPLPVNSTGQVFPLQKKGAVPPGNFTLISTNTVTNQIRLIDNQFSGGSVKVIRSVSKKPNDIVYQRLFTTAKSVPGIGKSYPAAAKSSVYMLYHTKNGQFKYRLIDMGGKGRGKENTAFSIKKKRLKWMNVSVFGKEALVVWSEKKTKKKDQVWFDTFKIK